MFLFVVRFCFISALVINILLLISGSSPYDEDNECLVVLENERIVTAKGTLKGILCLFLSYYVYGYKYPKTQEKTFEFIQRYV